MQIKTQSSNLPAITPQLSYMLPAPIHHIPQSLLYRSAQLKLFQVWDNPPTEGYRVSSSVKAVNITNNESVYRDRLQLLVLLTSSCQFSLNQTIWSTMPSSEDSRVGCSSRCMCMIRLQRHIGAVARMGPGSVPPEWGWAPTELGCC